MVYRDEHHLDEEEDEIDDLEAPLLDKGQGAPAAAEGVDEEQVLYNGNISEAR